MKKLLMLPMVALFIVGLAIAGANSGVNISGPHCQDEGTKTQVRLSIHKNEVNAIPGPPVGFVPYHWGNVEGQDNSYHVTLTADGYAPATSGTWAGQTVNISAFDGNKNCSPPETTTTTTPQETTTTTVTVNPCEFNDTCSDEPHMPVSETPAQPATPIVSNPADLGITG